MKPRHLAARCCAFAACALIAIAAGCSSSSPSPSSSAPQTLPPTTAPPPSTTTTTLAPAAAKAAAQAYLRGAGAPLLQFVRETAPFSGPVTPAGATLAACRQWVIQAPSAHLTYRELAKSAALVAAPKVRQAFGRALLYEWILVARCIRPSALRDSQAREAASARTALLRQLRAIGITL